MSIESDIIVWVGDEVASARLLGVEPKEINDRIKMQLKELRKIALHELRKQQKIYEYRKRKK